MNIFSPLPSSLLILCSHLLCVAGTADGGGVSMPGPKYPVVDGAPDLDKVNSNLSAGDYATWIGITLGSLPLGYAAGRFVAR